MDRIKANEQERGGWIMRKYKKTIIGSTILLLLLLASLLYPLYGPADYNAKVFIKDDLGNILAKAPFPPSGEHIMGSNRNGEDMHLLLLYGAKFTLITAFVVAVLRVLFGGFIGIFLSLWAPMLKSAFKDFFLAFRYIPSILIALILMMPIVGVPNDVSISSVVTYQIIILTFIGLPSVAILSSEITDELLKTSFVQSSLLMGAGNRHLLKRQLLPYMRSYGVFFAVQQLISTLHITMQLGIFGLFLGGQTRGGIYGFEEPPKPATISNEWAGLIGQNLNDFMKFPWTIFTPVLGFFIVIVIVNMIKKELEENLIGLYPVKIAQMKKKMFFQAKTSADQDFTFVNQDRQMAEKSF